MSVNDKLSFESKQTKVAASFDELVVDFKERTTFLSTKARRRMIALSDVIGFDGIVDDHGVG